MKAPFFAFIFALVLGGCALPVPGVRKSLLDDINMGDSHREVLRVFGHPHYRYSKGNTEFLLYCVDENGDGRADSDQRVVVMLVGGKVYDKGLEDRESGSSQDDPTTEDK